MKKTNYFLRVYNAYLYFVPVSFLTNLVEKPAFLYLSCLATESFFNLVVPAKLYILSLNNFLGLNILSPISYLSLKYINFTQQWKKTINNGTIEMKIDKIDKFLLLTAIPVILFGALLDVIFIKSHSFLNYVYICIWEYAIFWFGFNAGRKYYHKKISKYIND